MDNNQNDALNRFFIAHEKRALVMARIALNNNDEAMDVVQEAMLKLYTRYAKRPEAEWPPLFQRILQNAITDKFRHRTLASRFFTWFQSSEEQDDLLDATAAPEWLEPPANMADDDFAEQFENHLRSLSPRQRQVFLLRAWEGYSNEECAKLMNCAVGSVKSHYYRAQQQLRENMSMESVT